MPFISIQSIYKKLVTVITGLTERIATSFLYDTTASGVGRQVISSDGTWMMSSAGGVNTDVGSWSGIRVYKRTGGPGTSWEYVQEILPPIAPLSGKYDGWGADSATMSRDGNRIAVLADQLYVYVRSGDVWSLEDTVPVYDPANLIRYKTATFNTGTGVDATNDLITTDAINDFYWGNAYTARYSKNGGSVDIGLQENITYHYSNLRTSTSSSVTLINPTTDIITTGTHLFTTGDPIRYSTSGSKIAALTEQSVVYYVRVIDSTRFTLHPTETDALNNTNIIDVTMSRAIGTIAVVNGGSGYAVDDVLDITDGTLEPGAFPAVVRVTSVSGGVITGVSIIDGGSYTSLPATQVLRSGQTNTSYNNSPTSEGTFAGGTGYTAGNVLTLSNGATVTVSTVSSGVVTGFTVTSSTTTPVTVGVTLTSTGGTGSGFTITPDTDNVASLLTVTGGSGTGASLGGVLAALSGIHRFQHAKKMGFYTDAPAADAMTFKVQLTASGSETHEIAIASDFYQSAGLASRWLRIDDAGTRIVSNNAILSGEPASVVIWERTGSSWAEAERLLISHPSCPDLDPLHWKPGDNAYYLTDLNGGQALSGDGNTLAVSSGMSGIINAPRAGGYLVFTASNPLYSNKPTIQLVNERLTEAREQIPEGFGGYLQRVNGAVAGRLLSKCNP